MMKDPVCGMEIDEKEAASYREYERETYYFCSKCFPGTPKPFCQKFGRGFDTQVKSP